MHRPRTLLGERLNDMVGEALSDVDSVVLCMPDRARGLATAISLKREEDRRADRCCFDEDDKVTHEVGNDHRSFPDA